MSEATVRIFSTTKWKEEFGELEHLPIGRARIVDCLPSDQKRVPGKVYLHLYAEVDLGGNRFVALFTNIADEHCRPVWGPGAEVAKKEDRENGYDGNQNAKSEGPITGGGYHKRIRVWIEKYPEQFVERFDWDPDTIAAEGSEDQSTQASLHREEIQKMAVQLEAKENELKAVLRAKDEQVRALQLELERKDAILAQHGLSEEMNEDDAGADASGGDTVVGGGGAGTSAKAGKQQQQKRGKQQPKTPKKPKKPTRKQPPRSAARTSAPKQQEKGIEEEEEEEVVVEEETEDQSAEVARLKKQLQEVTAQLQEKEKELKEKDDTIAQYRREEDDNDGVDGGGWRAAYCGKEVSVQAGDGNIGGTVGGGVGGVVGEHATPEDVALAAERMRDDVGQKLSNFSEDFEKLCGKVKENAGELDKAAKVMDVLHVIIKELDRKVFMKFASLETKIEKSDRKRQMAEEQRQMAGMVGEMQGMQGPK